MGIRGFLNLVALAALLVGLAGSVAGTRDLYHWLLLGAVLFLLVHYLLWIVVGNRLGYQKPEDLRRADDEETKPAPMLGRYWPGPW